MHMPHAFQRVSAFFVTIMLPMMMMMIIIKRASASMIVGGTGGGAPKIIRVAPQHIMAQRIISSNTRSIRWLDHPPSLMMHQATIRTAPHFCQTMYLSATASIAADSEVKDVQKDNKAVSLNRTAIRKMKVALLREELSNRALDFTGRKTDLVNRLVGALKLGTKHAVQEVPIIKLHDIPLEEAIVVSDPLNLCHGDDDILAHNSSTTTSSPDDAAVDQSIFDEGDAAMANLVSLDPQHTYVIRVRSVPSGPSRVIQGFSVGISLRVQQSEDNNNNTYGDLSLPVVETKQVLLPGSQSQTEATYCALIMAVREATKRGVKKIIVEVVDDAGIVQQLTDAGQVGTRRPAGRNFEEELRRKVLDLQNDLQSFQIRAHLGQDEWEEAHDLAETVPVEAKQEPVVEVEPEPLVVVAPLAVVEPFDVVDKPPIGTVVEVPVKRPHAGLDPTKEYLMRFDGGARGNPSGVSGVGMVLYDGDQEIWCGWKYLGAGKTNNIAEYTALIEGLSCAQKLGVRRIRAEGDSELVVKQVLGQYKVKKEWLRPLHREVQGLLAGFDDFSLGAIRRARNSRADELANHAMDTLGTSLA